MANLKVCHVSMALLFVMKNDFISLYFLILICNKKWFISLCFNSFYVVLGKYVHWSPCQTASKKPDTVKA